MIFCWWLRLSGYKHMSYSFWVNLINKIFRLKSSRSASFLWLRWSTELFGAAFHTAGDPSPWGTFLHRDPWICSMRNVTRSSAICREWCERKMCLRLHFKIQLVSRSLRLMERTCYNRAYVKIRTVQEIKSGRAKDDRKSQKLHVSLLFLSDVSADTPSLCVLQFLNLTLFFFCYSCC